MSANSDIFYSNNLILTFSLAEIGTVIIFPSKSSDIIPSHSKSNKTFSTSASSLSILLIATIRGILSWLTKLMTSIVYF